MGNHLQTPKVREAREAAWRSKAENRHRLMVFIVRLSGSSFAWEIRHLGSIVHHRCTGTYRSAELARQAGEDALAALPDVSV